MTDQELLQAIRGIVHEEATSIVKEELANQRKELMHDVSVLMDAQFTPQFKLLSEEMEIIKSKLSDVGTMEKMQDELDLHHMLLQQHTREIQKLKKAN